MRTGTLRGLAALLVVACAVPALWAAPPEPTPGTEPTPAEILAQLKEINTKLSLIQANENLIKTMQDDIARLKDQVRDLQDQLRRLPAATNVSASVNPANPALPTAAPVNGRIVVNNRTNTAAHVVINDTDYLVLPFQQMVVTTPTGPFSYEVYADDFGTLRERTPANLTASRDYKILIHQ